MAEHRCEHCGKAIRGRSGQYLGFLKFDKRGQTYEVWIHNRCLDAYNGLEEDDEHEPVA